MKMTIPTVLLPLLLFVLSSKSLAANQVAVLDVWGNELVAGAKYYVLSAASSEGGGLTLVNGINQTCPYDVAQERFADGIPVTFSPTNSSSSNDQAVFESTDLNIEFVPLKSTACPNSTVWKLSEYDVDRQKWFVTTGGVETDPSSLFQIVRVGGFEFGVSYKFFYCPSNCDSCKRLCSEIGVYEDYFLDWKKRLVLAPTGVPVVFRRADIDRYRLKQVVYV